MTWGAAMLAALLIVLPRPATWIVALAAFLVRGGLVLFLIPIVTIPSPVELATAFGPTITTFVFSGLSPEFALMVGLVFALFLAWLLIGGWVAAATEQGLIETAAADEEVVGSLAADQGLRSRPQGRVWRVLVVRLAGHVPLAAVLGWGSLRIVQATYRELTIPSDVLTPIAIRVVGAVPDAVLAVLAAWGLGEVLGSLGSRRVVLRGQSIDAAYFGAWADLLRRPVAALATFVIPTVVLVAIVGPMLVASGVAWDALRILLAGGRASSPAETLVVLVMFLLVWSAGLLVAGLLAAWRSAAWTLESIRARGTFGASTGRRPGDRSDPEPSGSL